MTEQTENFDLSLAEALYGALVRHMGPGYHPDTRAEDYVPFDAPPGPSRPGAFYDAVHAVLLEVFRRNGVDPSAEAARALWSAPLQEPPPERTFRVEVLTHYNNYVYVQAADEDGAAKQVELLVRAEHPEAVLVEAIDVVEAPTTTSPTEGDES